MRKPPIDFHVTMTMRNIAIEWNLLAMRTGRAKVNAMKRAGAKIRQRAWGLVKRRKTTSKPGRPPTVWSRDKVASLRNMRFFYDPDGETLVVGPLRLHQQSLYRPDLDDATVPQLHEFGGTANLWEARVGNTWRMHIRSRRPGQLVRRRRATYPARPFMGPALEKEIEEGTLSNVWAGSVKAG